MFLRHAVYRSVERVYALVTGGGSGLGYHIAKELRTRGYKLVIVSRNERRLKQTATELKARYYVMDLSKDYKNIGKIIDDISPQVVVNNAGFGLYGYFPQQDFERIERMINLNITALTYITHRAIESMMNTGGYIMNVSSVAACHPLPKFSVYAATKAYVEHLTRSLSNELPPHIHISYLLLGPTRTEFFKNAGLSVEKYEKLFLNPEKVAKYAVSKMLSGRKRIVPGFIFKLYCLFK